MADNKVRQWPKVAARVSPEAKLDFERKLKENGESQNQALRRMIRNYGGKS